MRLYNIGYFKVLKAKYYLRYAWMEKFNGCFIIANFDSIEGDNEKSMELLETLSANFNEKCVIAANDVSFPSNRARFSNRIQFWKDFRYVIYRSPLKFH